MQYNTSRTKMLMPEYGRNVQRMVEFVMTIEDRDKRLRFAEMIVELMGTLNPHLKLIEDYRHKLWDHLYQMTDFKLDVDAPYPPPTFEQIHKRPMVLSYPQSKIRNRHLGKNLEVLLQKGMEEASEEKQHGFAQSIGYYMKLAYTNWHKEPIHDDMIKNELALLSDGKLQFEPGGYRVYQDKNRSFKNGNNNNNRNFKNNNNRPNNNQQRNNNNNPKNFGNNKNRNFKKKQNGNMG